MPKVSSQVQCDCCGVKLASGQGFLINASLSQVFAEKLKTGEKKRGTLQKLAPKLVDFRMKQVLACSAECASRAIDVEQEGELAQQAAQMWWKVHQKQQTGDLSKTAYITKAMLQRPEEPVASEAAAISGEPASESGGNGAASPSERVAAVISLPSRVLSFFSNIPANYKIGAIVAVPVLLLLVLVIFPFGPDGDGSSGKDDGAKPDANANRVSASEVTVPRPKTGVCRVYTPEPGFTVLVDESPVLGKDGLPVLTPCAVTTTQGTHMITVTRDKYVDSRLQVSVGNDSEAIFDNVSVDAFGQAERIVDAPYYDAKEGEPIELASLNTGGVETDPFVSSDGQLIYFAAEGAGGRGIYFASRPSRYHAFDEPKLIRSTRGLEMPASPSATADGLSVFYVVPEKARILLLSRPNPLAEFGTAAPVKFSKGGGSVRWPVAQVLSDGLRLYWSVDDGEEKKTLFSKRLIPEEDFSRQKNLIVTMPGWHPCFSSDGLRQYQFNGTTISRSVRAKPNQKLSKPEPIGSVHAENYTHRDGYRQFFVSDDEQWLFYSDDPVENGDLYMIRMKPKSTWAIAARGESIPDRVVEVATTEMKPKTPDGSEPRPVDPRSLPLPYTSHWDEFSLLLSERKYDEARELVEKNLNDSNFDSVKELVEWDQEELKSINAVWAGARKRVAELKPGEEVRLGSAKGAFAGFTDGVISGQVGGKTVEKTFTEMEASEILSLADEVLEKDDAQDQLKISTFLFYDATADPAQADDRLERAERLGQQFLDRQGRRKLRQARLELEREKLPEAIAFLRFAELLAGDGAAADEAAQLRGNLYSFVKWDQAGSRQWITSENLFEADFERTPNSGLVSVRKYTNFELTMDWKVTTQLGQGGVVFRYTGQGALDGRTNQYKIQLAGDKGVPADPFCTGALLAKSEPKENAAKAIGEWNTLKLRVFDGGVRVEAMVNDKVVLETTAPDPNIPFEGFVVLDGVIGGIIYRKILLSELPDN